VLGAGSGSGAGAVAVAVASLPVLLVVGGVEEKKKSPDYSQNLPLYEKLKSRWGPP
jgi:hypothetical protein